MISFVHQVFEIRNGPVPHVVRTVSFSILLVLAILLCAIGLGIADPTEEISGSPFTIVIGALAFAPLLENFLLILVIEFLIGIRLSETIVLVVVATLSGLAHGLVGDWRAVSGFILFAVMAHSYLIWHASPFSERYAITLAQHVLFNTPATISALIDWL